MFITQPGSVNKRTDLHDLHLAGIQSEARRLLTQPARHLAKDLAKAELEDRLSEASPAGRVQILQGLNKLQQGDVLRKEELWLQREQHYVDVARCPPAPIMRKAQNIMYQIASSNRNKDDELEKQINGLVTSIDNGFNAQVELENANKNLEEEIKKHKEGDVKWRKLVQAIKNMDSNFNIWRFLGDEFGVDIKGNEDE